MCELRVIENSCKKPTQIVEHSSEISLLCFTDQYVFPEGNNIFADEEQIRS